MGEKIATGRSDPKLKIAEIAAFDAVSPPARPKEPYRMIFFRFPPKIFPRPDSHKSATFLPAPLSRFLSTAHTNLHSFFFFPLFLFRSLVLFIPSTRSRILRASLDYK